MLDQLDCYLIGGDPAERIAIAARLRRNGAAIDLDYKPATTAKQRRKAWERGAKASIYGDAVVYDLDKPEDRAYLMRRNAFRENVAPEHGLG